MSIEWGEIVTKWLWAPLLTAWGTSFEARLGRKVSEKTCTAIHNGLKNEIKGLRKHVDDKFEDWKAFQTEKTDLIIGEIKKANGTQ